MANKNGTVRTSTMEADPVHVCQNTAHSAPLQFPDTPRMLDKYGYALRENDMISETNAKFKHRIRIEELREKINPS